MITKESTLRAILYCIESYSIDFDNLKGVYTEEDLKLYSNVYSALSIMYDIIIISPLSPLDTIARYRAMLEKQRYEYFNVDNEHVTRLENQLYAVDILEDFLLGG